MFINPKNENQYFCPKCGDTLDVNQADIQERNQTIL